MIEVCLVEQIENREVELDRMAARIDHTSKTEAEQRVPAGRIFGFGDMILVESHFCLDRKIRGAPHEKRRFRQPDTENYPVRRNHRKPGIGFIVSSVEEVTGGLNNEVIGQSAFKRIFNPQNRGICLMVEGLLESGSRINFTRRAKENVLVDPVMEE